MTEEIEEKEETLLIPRDQYLAAGIHIGTQIKTQDMVPFIYRITRAGLYVIDIRQTDIRMRTAAKFIARFDPKKVITVSARRYGHNPIAQFAHITGSHSIAGRFVPGTLTNPNARSFRECDLLIITDPRADKQALREAKIAKIPVIGFCDTDNNLTNIDVSVPANNRGRKALALIYWLLTRQVLLEKGEIARGEDFNIEINSYQLRSPITFAPSGERAKILAQLKEEPSVEEEEPKEEKAVLREDEPKEEDKTEIAEPKEEPKKKTRKTKPKKEEPEELVSEEPPRAILDEEVEGDIVKPEDLIEGPLPEKKPKKKASKKKEKGEEETLDNDS